MNNEEPTKVSNSNLPNSQFGGGLVNADTIKAERIGGDIHNNVVLNQPSIYITEQQDSSTNNNNNQAFVTPEEETTNKAKLEFVLTGSIDEFDKSKLKAIAAHLQKLSKDLDLTIIDTEEGSIKLILEGSPEGLKRLEELFKSGELTEVLGIPVEDVRFPSEEASSKDEKAEIAEEIRLMEKIMTRRAQRIKDQNPSGAGLSGADLSGAGLSGADLSGAGLSGADLSGASLIRANLSGASLIRANLSRANLSGANLSDVNLSDVNLSGAGLIAVSLSDTNLSGADLSDAILIRAGLAHANLSDAILIRANLSRAILIRANLSRANLSGANLSGADLSDARLSGANLSGADLSNAQVNGTRFGDNTGIPEEMKRDLIRRGAIFEDSLGDRDRSSVPSIR
ncbi:MAG: pentapeptide repeat-containing protein [Symploca sp. SIO3E6]|nr:pentapeptide repeat-containing protein [Caldora sp. SIO3E6]